jgi:serine/threonine protein kinase
MNLKNYYSSQETGLSLKKTRQITAQLAKALSFLDENNVIHGDIKSQNILMSADGESVTLADFGHATFSDPVYNPPDRALQSLWYRSPEVILEITATVAVDIWSLAAVIAEIYSNKVIFPSKDGDEALLVAYHHVRLKSSYPEDLVEKGTAYGQSIFERSSSKKVEIVRTFSQIIQQASAQKEEDSKQLIDLLDKMFVYNPKKRATPSKILHHPFLIQAEVLACDENPPKEPLNPDEEEYVNYW